MQSANEFINNRALVNYENIARNILYEGVFAATAKDNNDTLTITSQEVYGRYDYAVSINPNGDKKEYLIIQHLSSGINEITGFAVYIYDVDGTNLQQASYLSRYKDAEGIHKHVTPHVIRHTTAAIGLHNGMSINELSMLLGHSNIETTMIYAKTSYDAVKSAHNKCIV